MWPIIINTSKFIIYQILTCNQKKYLPTLDRPEVKVSLKVNVKPSILACRFQYTKILTLQHLKGKAEGRMDSETSLQACFFPFLRSHLCYTKL